MSMNGLERITEKILAEAREEAERIVASAEAECLRIREEYGARADEIRERLSAEAERTGTDVIAQAKAAAATKKRNLVLSTQSQLIDEVFDSTLSQIRHLEADKYVDILIGLLSAALIEQVEAESVSRTLYGEEDAIAPDAYEVRLNHRDLDRHGQAMLDGARQKLSGKLPKEVLDKLVLSQDEVNIDGGLILRCGSVEANCSLSLLFAQLREELEAEVSHALFAPDKRL